MGQAAVPQSDNRFYDKSTEHFSAIVGQFAARSGYIKFADAELPPDPNTPVVRSSQVTLNGIDLSSDVYSLSIEGADSDMFTASITQVSASENGCTVRIVYRPTAVGTHTAKLNVYCTNAGSPCTSINLSGEGIAQPGDVDGNGQVGISDVSRLIDLLLKNQ
jgi:hypothetical protein